LRGGIRIALVHARWGTAFVRIAGRRGVVVAAADDAEYPKSDDHQHHDCHRTETDAENQRGGRSGLLFFLSPNFVIVVVAASLTFLGERGFAVGRLLVGAAAASRRFVALIFFYFRLLDHEAVFALRAVDLFADEAGIPDGNHRLATRTLLPEPCACRHRSLSVARTAFVEQFRWEKEPPYDNRIARRNAKDKT